MSYVLPGLPPGSNSLNVVDILQAGTSLDELDSAAAYTTQLTRQGQAAPLQLSSPLSTGQNTGAVLPDQPDRPVWELDRDLYTTVTMTTELCQAWAGLVRQGNAFAAVRVPMASPAPTGSYTLPLVLTGQEPQVLALMTVWPETTVVSIPLEYRPERFSFAENELPAAAGERWLALGAAADAPITCPAGLELTPQQWMLRVKTTLDLTGQPDNCAGCVVQSYFCYEGQDPPNPAGGRALAALERVLGAGVRATHYQGSGITCVGPAVHNVLPLDETEWDLYESNVVYISPTVTTTLAVAHHLGETVEPGPVVVDLDYTSDVPAEWHLYGGTFDTPDLGDPLTLPLTLNGNRLVWWVTSLPTDMAYGPYYLLITASASSTPTSQVASDLFWVGGWVAPPTGEGYRVYLPLVLRSFGP